MKETGGGTSIFNAAGGAVGSAFTEKGAVGGMAQKIGGPLDSQGMFVWFAVLLSSCCRCLFIDSKSAELFLIRIVVAMETYSISGAIGSAFTTQGAIGGKFQDLAKKNESH